MTELPSPRQPRDARFMAWLQRKNAEYAPVLVPASVLGLVASFGLNRPEFGIIFGTLLASSLTAGGRK
jgi:hypothetical protein